MNDLKAQKKKLDAKHKAEVEKIRKVLEEKLKKANAKLKEAEKKKRRKI